MHDRLWVHHNVDPIEPDPVELIGLDDLEALVHQRGRVDGDLGPHRPCRMCKGFVDRHRGQVGRGSTAKRPPAGGDHQPLNLVKPPVAERLVGAKALV